MRVLNFLDSLNRGGAEILQLDVCRTAGDFGIEMMLASSLGGQLESDFKESGIEYVRMSRRLPIDPLLVRSLRNTIRKHRIDIVHGHQAVEGIHLYLATLGLKVKKVLSFQGFVPDKKTERTLRFLIPRMDANLVVSEGLRQRLSSDNGLDTGSFSVLFNGASTTRLQKVDGSLRQELKIGEDALIIGMIGNFYRDPRKDQMTLVRALPLIRERLPNIHCVFAGKTEPGAEDYLEDCRRICVEAGIGDRVHFLGGRNDVPNILSSLDLFVLSSLHEGLPISQIEAMLMGLPCLVSDIPQLREVTNDGKAAMTFETGNPVDLAQKLILILADKDVRASLAKRGYDHAIANFSIDAHIRNLRMLYGRILEP